MKTVEERGGGARHVVFCTHVQDKSAVQIMSEWNNDQNNVALEHPSKSSTFVASMHHSFGSPASTFHVSFSQSMFGLGGPASANVIENVQIYFPTSQVTPEFQKQIEQDFAKFNEIVMRGSQGDVGLATGWVQEEQEHKDITEEKAKCFFVIRGWESMAYIEELTKQEVYKEAIPLLLAWNAPFKLVRICALFYAV
ncbi:hypothetical protein P153DRAFT_301958 [Dothidotthia symphoricarpi CBS 119687]|uniref:ABM domain-containing protein n=1 Tax=Dothidotthia symphoricarpi CBS 119687 TaxID=1392245 RepID=A0A6A6A0V3_9PLEO|nr:uncharacterized protein P153DRAFT_301958 [Dothidotthia symphoricarpi CBS 119687]KAF2124338.1 hypothetical protein P153DRAFT_301958 [Dothidotthia symphoricarpi CBS 119687]